jgi:hypothetical protein
MVDHIPVPIKTVGKDRWGQLCLIADTFLICGESVDLRDQKFSFAGNHRLRLYRFRKSVNFKIPDGIALDIAEVLPASAPRRTQRN